MGHDDATLEKAAAATGADIRKVKRLCGRCEERLKAGEKTVVAEFAPYAGIRLHLKCAQALTDECVPPEP